MTNRRCKSLLGAEAMFTRVDERSAMFDGDIAHENVRFYSLSDNFAFLREMLGQSDNDYVAYNSRKTDTK